MMDSSTMDSYGCWLEGTVPGYAYGTVMDLLREAVWRPAGVVVSADTTQDVWLPVLLTVQESVVDSVRSSVWESVRTVL